MDLRESAHTAPEAPCWFGPCCSIAPKAVNGAPLGPGLAPTIHASVTSGQGRVAAVRDNLNGSYSIDIRDVRPGAILRLDVGGTKITVPLGRTAAAGKS